MKKSACLAVMLLAASSGSFANGVYVSGQVSRSDTSLDRSYFHNQLTGAGGTGVTGSDDGQGTQWRLQGGYRFNPNFAVEAGYIDLGKSSYQASYTGGSASGELKAGGVDVAALAILPLGESFSVFGKAGAIAASIDATLTASAPAAAASGKSSTHEVLPLLGVGASYKLSQNFDLRADFDRVSGIGKSSKTGEMDSNMFSLGATYTF